jgi:hypothetical protein
VIPSPLARDGPFSLRTDCELPPGGNCGHFYLGRGSLAFKSGVVFKGDGRLTVLK